MRSRKKPTSQRHCFFFQAEDGIRDRNVTGVQTCALPIYLAQGDYSDLTLEFLDDSTNVVGSPVPLGGSDFVVNLPTGPNAKYQDAKEWGQDRSEERRVGKERRSGWSTDQ